MSYDFTIWKWAESPQPVTPDELFAAIGKDEAHPALQRFDTKGFVKALYAAFGGEEFWFGDDADPPFMLDVADFTGTPANWIVVNMSYGRIRDAAPKLIELAGRFGLVVFDHQTEQLHGSE